MKRYKIAFLGGSAFACGGALFCGKDAVVIERNIVLGSEFTLTLGKTKISQPDSQMGQSFYNELLKRELIHDKMVHLPPVSDVLAEWMLKSNCQVYLDCEIVNIHRQNEIYEIEFWSCDGMNTIYAERIVDTTEIGFLGVGSNYISAQYLCGALKGSLHEITREGNYYFVQGPLEEENVFVCKIPRLTDYRQARQIFYSVWKKARARNPYLYLVSEGQKMIYEYTGNVNIKLDDRFRWIPSGQYEDIMKAFEEGTRCSL